ncbi:hypothetical protein K469DRAFT_711515 [Zopfia rhizophila CBS 207.26]|uniref:WD40 repeat-like protein n=1 Tax=Zopfia rhizophila CBS 207.26 TaxID=1314779 RepID=A0A6A6DUU5_9PEZI|nr:hypothetical protein K469DRAFT_711515 [Zopfia rhizophila CBS 207.26]
MLTPLSCTATNIQRGYERFMERDPHERPRLKSWRCDLTALSQVYNLYFVACSDTIHVYQPNFPDQRLSDEPDLILYPPVSRPNLHYAVDPTCPHSITRLYVDFLGREEIVLVACDDGDVIGYSVSQIQHAIDGKSPNDGSQEEHIEDGVRVFFHRNVGLSAWGLAVHREARLIAISANTRLVTVIAFALASRKSPDSDTSDTSIESSTHIPLTIEENESDFPCPRRKEHVLSLKADHNIPSVNFDNTDPTGRWLLSCAIDGNIHLWDLHKSQSPARRIRLGYCVNVGNHKKSPAICTCPDGRDLPHAVWNAMFVDARSCRRCEFIHQALGNVPTRDSPIFWNITRTTLPGESDSAENQDEVSETSESEANYFGPQLDDQALEITTDSNVSTSDWGTHGGTVAYDNASEDEDMSDAGSNDESVEESAEEEDEQSEPSAEVPATTAIAVTGPDEAAHTGNEPIPTTDDDFLQFLPLPNPAGAPIVINEEVLQLLPPQQAVGVPFSFGTVRDKKAYFEENAKYTLDGHSSPQGPTIIVTKQDIFLLQPFAPDNEYEGYPIIVMRNPLTLLGNVDRPMNFDRLCYSTQIPELGIFIVGSPVGCVAIFSLTQFEVAQPKPRARKTLYGFRRDHLLPFCEDDEHPVPARRLVGIAVSPIQGMLDMPDEEKERTPDGMRSRTFDVGARRWRLMLMYQDHTVLSYELGKYRRDDDMSLGALVV